ncbi:MAG TPA: sugar ABC transporter substrate-binding protein [Longimicrobiales bacterium]|nr:sugar ABC transporter substrate-binding protein [Longimicrobiales bacterium]
MNSAERGGSHGARRGAWRRAAAAALLLAVAVSGGCAPSSRGDDVTTIRFWGMGREGEVVAELIAEFERDNPDIRVRTQQIPWTAAHEKLLTAYVGNATPDVAQLGNTWVAEFAAIRALEPLDERIAASADIAPAGYFPGIWDTNVVNDTTWGVPWYVDTRVLFYRTDLLAAAGYESMPETWPEWMEAMRALKRQMGPDGYAIFLPTNEWAQPALFGLQSGSGLLTADGRHGVFSEPSFRQGFEFYLNLFREDLAPPLGHHDVTNPYQEMGRGFFAMWITGPWNLGEFRTRLPPELQDSWATAPMPGPTGVESGISLAGGASLVVFRASRHRDAAWRLVEFLSRPEQQLRFYELTGSLPARTEAWEQSDLATARLTRAFWEQLQRVEPLPAVPEIESIMSRLIEHSEAAIRGGATAERVLTDMDRDTDRILEKRRWLLDRNGGVPQP